LKYLSVLPLLLLILCAAISARAQSTDATISGVVVDSAGKDIQDARIEIVNDATGVHYSSETNGTGIYTVTILPPGEYRIQVSKVGFKTIIKPDIVLNVQSALALNFTLPVGATSESVTVEAGSTPINTTDASVSTVIDRNFVANIPLNGRSFQTLIELTPGVIVTPSNIYDAGQFSINGQRAASNYWTVDGVSANVGIGTTGVGNPGNGLSGTLGSFSAVGGTNSLVSVDALQEFRIQTSTFAPEFGRTPGGQISIATRSGGAQFHGTAFDYLRNDVFDANNWFNGYTNNPPLSKARERQNDFGGTLGGPLLWKRTFFFASYEGLRLQLPQTAITTVPDASFTPGTTNSRNTAISAVQPYFNSFPLPNANSAEIFLPCDPSTDPSCSASGQEATGSANFNSSYSNPASLDASSIRLDHQLNDSLSIFGRYNYSPSDIVQRGGGSSLSTVSPSRITVQTATAGATWSISSAKADELRVNYSRTNASSNAYLDNFGGALPLPSLPILAPFSSANGFFSFNVASLQQGILSDGESQQNLQRQANIVDNMSIQEGSHNLKFGVDFRGLSPVYAPPAYVQGVAFLDIPSAVDGQLEDSQVASSVNPAFLFRNLGLYVQDTWHRTSSLTLTYGFRWDVDFVPQSVQGPGFPAVTNFDLNNLSTLALAAPGTPPYRTTYDNLAPRIGVAYAPHFARDSQTVLRGGFGVFYDLASSEAGNLVGGSYPFASEDLSFGGSFPLNASATTPPPITADSLKTGVLYAFDPNLKLPYTLEWNGALEQSVGKDQTFSMTYVGSAGRRLLQTATILAPNANFEFLQAVTNAAVSNYQALQAQFQRRLSRRLQALASYGWSHSIDTGSAGSVAVGSNALAPSAVAGNRGPSDFDIRNAFSCAFTYELPPPKIARFADAVLSGWSTENVIQSRTAPPVNVTDASLYEFNGGFLANVRPDLVPGQPPYLDGAQYPGGKAFNPAAFTNPPIDPTTGNPLRQGDVSRNSLRGFGMAQWDFGVHRKIQLHESLALEFRAEMFNILNHPNFGQPSGQFGVGGFGVATQTLGQSLSEGFGGNVGGGAFSPLYQLGGPRSMQFALKFTF
jgi:hypothetical protein